MLFVRNPDAAYRIIEGQAVILTPGDSRLHTLNEVGTFIWECLDGKSHAARIVEKMCRTFDVNLQAAEKDVNHFLSDLIRRGLVTTCPK
jgi:hypothetical protein